MLYKVYIQGTLTGLVLSRASGHGVSLAARSSGSVSLAI